VLEATSSWWGQSWGAVLKYALKKCRTSDFQLMTHVSSSGWLQLTPKICHIAALQKPTPNIRINSPPSFSVWRSRWEIQPHPDMPTPQCLSRFADSKLRRVRQSFGWYASLYPSAHSDRTEEKNMPIQVNRWLKIVSGRAVQLGALVLTKSPQPFDNIAKHCKTCWPIDLGPHNGCQF